MKIKRAAMMAVLVVAVAALTVPLVGMRARAAGSTRVAKAAAPAPTVQPVATPVAQQTSGNAQRSTPIAGDAPTQLPRMSDETFNMLGIPRAPKGVDLSAKIAKAIKSRKNDASGPLAPQSGEPEILAGNAPFSAALLTTIGGRDNQFSEVELIADWDGREDCVADRSRKVDDFSGIEPEIDFSLTRTAISEHTIANGFAENVFYYGDSVGNVWVGVDTTGDGRVDTVTQLNLPTLLNAFGTINSDDQVAITGLAVNPVADLTSFPNVNGGFATFAGLTGEILYVTYLDTESGLRLAVNNTPVRSGLLAFPIADLVSPAAAPPGVQSVVGFPVTVGGAFGVAFSTFSFVAGCSCDDDGSVYFQQADLIQFTGGNIVEAASIDQPNFALPTPNQDRSLATNGFLTITSLNPTNGAYGNASGPANQITRFTNYSGTSTLFGDVVALANGGCNTLFAAVSKSNTGTTDVTEGRFPAPSQFGTAGTPSMIISFADCAGAFDLCTSPATGFPGLLPVADGFADVAASGLTRTPGVNNFRIFALGNGPDIRPATGGTAVVPGTLASVLRIDMQIDFTLHSGIAVNEDGTVFVISGGTPAGIGTNPSPLLTEVLCFEDVCPADRRGDFVDFRGNGLPNPPASGGAVGDGDSDRFDHIFFVAPIDQVTLTPAGMAGLSRGFLLYTNRLRVAGPANLLNGAVQTDDTSSGPLVFEEFDPSHQVAGGDDQNPPFRGDDNDGAGNPALAGPLSGGFEFVFGGPVGTAACVWNALFMNSNGNITFGLGDSDNSATVPEFRTNLPKIAAAWADLNPGSRAAGFVNTFPVQALGFSNINAFKVRNINIPEFGHEGCDSRNTFSVTLLDDGTGIDENANQPLNPANPIGNNAVPFDLQEGPTDLRFAAVTLTDPVSTVIAGCPSRRDGSGVFTFDYCRMDILGTETNPVITGFSIGGLAPFNPPGLCETNLSEAARAADQGTFGVIQGQIAAIGCPNCCIGEGTEPTIFELFNQGLDPQIGSGGEITFATPDFDLRFEGNDAALCTPSRQRDLNRGRVCFLGVGCAPPTEVCLAAIPGAFVTTPTTTGLVNALCTVNLNLLGCGFFPNETTIVCQGFSDQTGIPLQRPGKTVSTAAVLTCDTNADGIPDALITLANVTPTSCNLITARLVPSPTFGPTSTSAFPATCCGGPGFITITTTFTAGDNNVFGPFTRTAVCPIDLGVRAPVVISATPSTGNCAQGQDLLISGACFTVPGPITSVFAVERGNPANVIFSNQVAILNPNLIDAFFVFGSVNAGKTFLIFVTGPTLPSPPFPAGTRFTSRNRTATQAGEPAGCALGNEQGIQVSFTCNAASGGGGGGGNPLDLAVLTSCSLDRNSSGAFLLTVLGRNIKTGATVKVGSVTPKKVQFRDVDSGTNAFNRLVLKGRFCNGLPGAIVVTNPGAQGGDSAPLNCALSCPAQ